MYTDKELIRALWVGFWIGVIVTLSVGGILYTVGIAADW